MQADNQALAVYQEQVVLAAGLVIQALQEIQVLVVGQALLVLAVLLVYQVTLVLTVLQ